MDATRVFLATLTAAAMCSLGAIALQLSGDASRALQPLPASAATVVAGESAGSSTEADPESAAVAVEPAVVPTAPAPLAPAPEAPVAGLQARVKLPEAVVSSAAKAEGLLGRMNAARMGEGLAALEAAPALDAVALERAQELIAGDYFDHYGPNGESAFTALGTHGIRYHLAGENLARNNYPEGETVAVATEGLMASPGHRANILEPRFRAAGVAAVQSGRMWLYVTVFVD